MKKLFILSVTLLLFCSNITAQMDDKFYHPDKTIQPMDSMQYEQVFIAVDSIQLSGIFLKPITKPKTTILFLHGNGGNVSTYLYMVKPLINAGFQVFMIDFRGYGNSNGTPAHVNIARDGQLVFDYLLQREDVNRTKIIIYGASIGSQEAVHLTKNNQTKIAALVLDGAMSSFTDIAAAQASVALQATIRLNLISPYSAKEDIKSIKNIPKLFIHSQQDKEVPYSEGKLVFNNAKNPKIFFEYHGNHLQAMLVNPAGVLKGIRYLINYKHGNSRITK